MTVWEIEDVRDFMNKLLREEAFDSFEVRSVLVSAAMTYELDGKLDKDFFEEAPAGDYALWKEVRPLIFELIKGKQRPKQLKVVFSAPPKVLESVPEAKALFLNLLYEKERVIITTGFAAKTFSLDKEAEHGWDSRMEAFLRKIGLAAQKPL